MKTVTGPIRLATLAEIVTGYWPDVPVVTAGHFAYSIILDSWCGGRYLYGEVRINNRIKVVKIFGIEIRETFAHQIGERDITFVIEGNPDLSTTWVVDAPNSLGGEM